VIEFTKVLDFATKSKIRAKSEGGGVKNNAYIMAGESSSW
jgi:hypothetical protein